MTTTAATSVRVPRLGFLGVGWIGRHRLEAIASSGRASVAMIADRSSEAADRAARLAGGAVAADGLDALIDADLDGIVIATPSALHASQAMAALSRGLAVFCQKPLARTGAETRLVVDAARRADRLLGVDFCYRHLAAMTALKTLVASGELGHVFAVDAAFHNAYGPDKAWCRTRRLSGGGCLMDLGVHMVDLALWLLDFPAVADVSGRLFAQGRAFDGRLDEVEDFATARLDLSTGTTVSVAASWNQPAGQDAVIRLTCYGTRGGAVVENVNGSFYDFRACRHRGTSREVLVEPPDAWGGRAVLAWVDRLAVDRTYAADADRYAEVADVLDRVYAS